MAVDCPTCSDRPRVGCAYGVSVTPTCGVGGDPGHAIGRCPSAVARNDRGAAVARDPAAACHAPEAAARRVNDRHIAAPPLPLVHDASAAAGGLASKVPTRRDLAGKITQAICRPSSVLKKGAA